VFGTSAFAAAPFAALAGGATVYDSAVEEAATALDTAVNVVALFAPLILEEIAVGENIVVAESDFNAAVAETITALDTPSALAVFPAYFEDVVSVSDTFSALVDFSVSVSEAAAILDIPVALVDFVTSVTDSATVSDTFDAFAGRHCHGRGHHQRQR